MTGHAAVTCLFGIEGRKPDYLGWIAARIDMRLTGTVAGLASLPLRAFVLADLRSPMGAVLVAVSFRFMTRLARVSTDVQRRIGRLIYRT